MFKLKDVYTCISRLKDGADNDIGYYLMNSNKTEIWKLRSDVLRCYMSSGNISISNISLDSNNQIVINDANIQIITISERSMIPKIITNSKVSIK